VLGPSPQPALREYPLDVLEHVYRVNVIGPIGLIQEALTSLGKRHGAIVNITSDAAVEGYEGWGGYGSSKAALEQVSRVLAAEQPDVRVYWFDPGDMRTQMHQEAFPGEDISDRPRPESIVPALLRLLEDSPPSGRYRAADHAGPRTAVAAS
jgi:NAD(P)-dependent dehydrogenase (short-subunit alcohol dehydrogenase family)